MAGASAPSQQRRWAYPLAYNAGRIVSYMFAGALAGAAGQAGLLLRGSVPWQQVFMLAGALTLCLMALYLAGITPLMRGLESAGALLWRQVAPVTRRMLPVDSVPKALGLLWGWLPCGMVYAALLLALSTAHPAQGATVMLAFGLGTLPNMLLMSAGVQTLQRMLKVHAVRWLVVGVLAAAGVTGMVHAHAPDAAQGDGFFWRVLPGWLGR